MKKFWIFGILVLIGFGWWFNRYPAFKNKFDAHITIFDDEADSVLYRLENVPAGGFEYNIKMDPKIMYFSIDGFEKEIKNDGRYSIRVDYIDSTLFDIKFM